MIDLHFHALPGLDDGPPDLAAAVALVRAAAAEGVTGIVATPHVNWDVAQHRCRAIADAVRRLRAELAAQSVAVDDPRRRRGRADARPRARRRGAAQRCDSAAARGCSSRRRTRRARPPSSRCSRRSSSAATGIVLAHVERCPAFLDDETLLPRLVAGGMLASITAGSLAGRFGRDARRAAELFISAGLVHNVASDAHNRTSRPPGLLRELDAAGLRPQAQWLVSAVPRAILTGGELPPPPAWPQQRARRRFLARLGRRP